MNKLFQNKKKHLFGKSTKRIALTFVCQLKNRINSLHNLNAFFPREESLIQIKTILIFASATFTYFDIMAWFK